MPDTEMIALLRTPGLMIALMSLATVLGAETLRFDTQILEVQTPVADGLTHEGERWVVTDEAAASITDGMMRLRSPEDTRVAAWWPESIEGAHLITLTLTADLRGDEGEAAIALCASLADDGNLLQAPDSTLDDLLAYALTLRSDGMRLIEYPDDKRADRNLRLPVEPGVEHEIAIFKAGRRLRVFVDDRLALDWWIYGEMGMHEEPLDGGHVGLSVTSGELAVSDFALHRVTSNQVAMIDDLKDPNIETNLGPATILTGDADSHAQAAVRIADAIREQTGNQVEVVADADPDEALPGEGPLIVVGNFADNPVIERLYFEWYTIVDRRFPGEGGYYLQTIHDPYGVGHNIVVVGASDDAGLSRAAAEFVAHIPADGVIGSLYEVDPCEEYMALTEWDYGERLIIPADWPQHFTLPDYASRDDPRHSGMVYLLTGDDAWAERYREQMLRWIDRGLINHLYAPGWMEIWALIEEHPIFADEERLAITNFFLTQVRSREGIGSLHIQRWPWGMAHQNHGTRPGVGTFFMARYFKHGYAMPEMDVYLSRISDYFGMQDDWSKPMCDSSMHQWEATLENKATYALASGEMRFFTTGAARQAAERALRTMDNVGHLPTIGDAHYASGPYVLLAMCAHVYQDGRYLWPNSLRGDFPRANTDEVLRTFIGDVQVERPDDIVGVSVVPYDRGFWEGWRDLPEVYFFNPPNIEYERAFDKLAMRTGLDVEDEFLLLDGMVGASHCYDDTNTIHMYARNGREYLVSYDNLFSSTIAWHNGVNIIRDGLSTEIPYFAEVLHAEDLGQVMMSQTRANDFADADWTRTILLAPERYFVVIDGMTAREPGTFIFTGHWKTLGEPEMDGETLTVAQWPQDEERSADNETFFHMQTPAQRVNHRRLPEHYARGARFYPYATQESNIVAQSINAELGAGETDFLHTLAQETGNSPQPRYLMHRVAPGVARIEGEGHAALAGAPAGSVEIGRVMIDADAFYLGPEAVSVAGGRTVSIDGIEVLSATQPVTLTLRLADGEIIAGEGQAQVRALPEEARQALGAQLASAVQDLPDVRQPEDLPGEEIAPLWTYDAGGEVRHLRAFAGNPGTEVPAGERPALPEGFGVVAVPSAAGHAAFLAADGSETARFEVDAPVFDVCVDDITGDGRPEVLLARDDNTLECRDADGVTRWTHQPETRTAINTALFIRHNPALHTFVVDLEGTGEKTVCVATGDQRLRGVSPDGEPRWEFWSYAGLFGIHGLYDLTGDGRRELVGGNPSVSSTDALYFLDGNGRGDGRGGGDRFVRRILNDGWGSTLSSMAIGDVTGDGRPEIVFGTGRASLYLIAPTMDDDGRIFQHKLGDDVRGVEIIPGTDGTPLIVAGATSGFISAFDASGEVRWSNAVGGAVLQMTSAIVDGAPVIVAALLDGEVLVLCADGQTQLRGRVEGQPSTMTVTVGDAPLIVVGEDTGTVTAFPLEMSERP